ncbi:M48 family metalloprotease [Archaeoglobus neptunius]|uniref:M48 family metalloprotease n=1 Tax=Archaeoglobus neptunius TaxID=2798580 RepID=UPI00192607BA|nr:M48 family metalloprotease [Archaeoglobus neptunius]
MNLCLISCLDEYGATFSGIGLVIAVAAIGYFRSNGFGKLKYYWGLNVALISLLPVLYLGMDCEFSLIVKLYVLYALSALTLFLIAPVVYRWYLSEKYSIERLLHLESFLRDVSSSKRSRLFVFSSQIPKAFTLGRDVFLSKGLLEILNEEEIRAVIAHEAFHVRQNRYPLIRNLRVLTFIPAVDFEKMADEYANRLVGEIVNESAKKKILLFYLAEGGLYDF